MAPSIYKCCIICQVDLVKRPGEAYRCLNDQNVEIIGRFAKAWMEQGLSLYDQCEKLCRKYKEQKCDAVFHVQCYRVLLSNAEYLDACKKSSSSVNSTRNGEMKTSAAAHSNRNSATSSRFSPKTSREMDAQDKRCLEEAALILRESILKIPNGVFNAYSDEPLVYEFFARICYGETAELPLKNQEYHNRILFLCKAVVAAVHKYKNESTGETSEESD